MFKIRGLIQLKARNRVTGVVETREVENLVCWGGICGLLTWLAGAKEAPSRMTSYQENGSVTSEAVIYPVFEIGLGLGGAPNYSADNTLPSELSHVAYNRQQFSAVVVNIDTSAKTDPSTVVWSATFNDPFVDTVPPSTVSITNIGIFDDNSQIMAGSAVAALAVDQNTTVDVTYTISLEQV